MAVLPSIVSLMKVLLDLHFVFMDFLLWSCLEFCCHVYLDDVYASDKVTYAGNGLGYTLTNSVFIAGWVSFDTHCRKSAHI
jgi:hypothetical protein